MTKKFIAIGDIHGVYKELQKLLDKLEVSDKDEVWAVGDAFDRAGPTCAMKVYEIFQKYNINYIWGNHDGELAFKIKSNIPVMKPWYSDWWNNFNTEAKDWFLKSEKYYHYDQEKKILLTHAGVYPYRHWTQTDPRVLCTIQCMTPWNEKNEFDKLRMDYSNIANYWPKWLDDEKSMYNDINIVFGHTRHDLPHDRIYDIPSRNIKCYATDWGAVRGLDLAAFVWEDGVCRFESVKAEKDYYYESYKKKKNNS